MKALVLASGGVDSTTCLGLAVKKYGADQCLALCISYGQRHEKEILSSREVADYYGVELIHMDLSSIFTFSDCSLLSHSDKDVPEQSYEEQLKNSQGNPVSTYVPFRNGLFISTAASIALSRSCSEIYYGAHMDDAAGNAYPDCSQAFWSAMNTDVWEGSGKQLKLEAPFIEMNKAQIVAKGLELGVPYELTWSCYEGGDRPCGKCGTCIDRARAFAANGVPDPALARYEKMDRS